MNDESEDSNDLILEAVKYGRVDEVKALLNEGADAYGVWYDGGQYAITLPTMIGFSIINLGNKNSPNPEHRHAAEVLEKGGATIENLKATYNIVKSWQETHPGEYENSFGVPLMEEINWNTGQGLLKLKSDARDESSLSESTQLSENSNESSDAVSTLPNMLTGFESKQAIINLAGINIEQGAILTLFFADFTNFEKAYEILSEEYGDKYQITYLQGEPGSGKHSITINFKDSMPEIVSALEKLGQQTHVQ